MANLGCSKLFEEIKILQSFCDKYQLEIGNLKDVINRSKLESEQNKENRKLLLNQKLS